MDSSVKNLGQVSEVLAISLSVLSSEKLIFHLQV